ncbi:MAG: DUF805 domain-containing protein [Treponema sp.]|jgi:uncharacterized membrane protein YhaH (DUF805 family)|nr:DUF805 domain-containing protein [Treponema sp.]
MELIEWYKAVVFSKYAAFKGRARRKEYWFFTLDNYIINTVLWIAATQIKFFTALSVIYSCALLIPMIAVCVRRLHDTNRSGLCILFVFIPLVGSILLLIWLAKEGDAEHNQYGPNPKSVPA